MKKRIIKPFNFNYTIEEIKSQNLYFSITYQHQKETYTDYLKWNEIFKTEKEISILKIEIYKREKKVLKLNSKNAKKLINILDLYNKSGLKSYNIKPTKAPTEKELIFCISLYFPIPPNYTTSQITFKYFLENIINRRMFLLKIDPVIERNIFLSYIINKKSKTQLSIELTNHTRKGVYIINKYLQLLVTEIKGDHEKGILQVQEYKKPLPFIQKVRKRNKEINKKLEDFKNLVIE